MKWQDRLICASVGFSIASFIVAYINNGSMWTYVPSFVGLILATIVELQMERKPMTEQRNDFTIRFKDGIAAERDERIITAVDPGNRWFCDMGGTTWWRIDEAGPDDPAVAVTEYAEVSREANPEGGTIVWMAVVSHRDAVPVA